MAQSALDKDLRKITGLESQLRSQAQALAAPGLTIVFLIGAAVLAMLSLSDGPLNHLVLLAAVVAAYMALNIGANDVANNMGPAVGSKALTLGGALLIAAICEATGAILAGGDVVSTISSDLLHPAQAMAPTDFILIMMSASLAAALWTHLATFLGAPVSTTHAVVGGVIGAGMAAAGADIVTWPIMGSIAASWVISPLMGGAIASALLALIDAAIIHRQDRVAAARRWVPVLVALMTGIFAMYIVEKGLRRIWAPSEMTTLLLGAGFALLGWAVAVPWVRRNSIGLENRVKHVSSLFALPLIMATGLLSFAHGANDVANAVGPLAAIVSAAASGSTTGNVVALPIWVLAIGGVGIAVGLSLFGPRVIRTVGQMITKMNEMRAYCVALSAAVTVLLASALGLPVSSTHIAVGAVFGVGFLREWKSNRGLPNPGVQPRSLFLRTSKLNKTPQEAIKNFQKRERRRLVRRQHAFGIAAAWIVTVPASMLLSALLYLLLGALAA
ncbi:inorganic phosphate transporter [Consotaella salsifontis]|uniref:Phosphate transporter n=1 Tax=Consotaella salsifontis TaxID=1365950 RepID=A0A1T4T7L1_9HYPH|nr:inorganic phosphate transporter [Consotaella salsifontis]SKA36329.1 inorganic phosphate transporter, PiT family [Consotaella salsifontis]